MSPLTVVVGAEFVRRIRSRAYILATLIGALSVIVMTLLPSLFTNAIGEGGKRLVLAGEPALLADARPLLARDFEVVDTVARVDGVPGVAFLDAHHHASAVAILNRNGKVLRVTMYARDPSLYGKALQRDLAPLQLALDTGIPVAVVQRRLAVPVDVHDVAGHFADVESATAAKGVAYLFVFLLYIAILLNAQAIMASVAEEKTSRIAELLVASIDPALLLAGKVIASAATGVVQLAVWIAAGAASGGAFARFFSETTVVSHGIDLGPLALPPGEIVSLVAFFLVGFLQYAVLYAGAASLINRTEDLGSVAGPLVVPVVIGFLLAQLGLQSPGTPSVVVCSELPLLAPFVMFTRIAVSSVPIWQIVLSLALNVAAAAALAIVAGRVYRVGLLLYGRAPSLGQIVATLRA